VCGAFVSDLKLDLGALAELFDGEALLVLALDLSKDVEGRVEMLRVVLVGVGTEFVVVH
jgi:hypothetical protein